MTDQSFDNPFHTMQQDDADEAASSIDAVRCMYLARIAERNGHSEAAQRWEEKAQRWMKKVSAAED